MTRREPPVVGDAVLVDGAAWTVISTYHEPRFGMFVTAQIERGGNVMTVDAEEIVDVGGRGWFVKAPWTEPNPRTGWPWPGVIGHAGEDEGLTRARQRAAIRIRVLRALIASQVASDDYRSGGLYAVIPSTVISDMRAEIRSIRSIFQRPASRPGRSDFAGLALGAAAVSRGGSALPETSDATSGSPDAGSAGVPGTPGPAAVPSGGGRDLDTHERPGAEPSGVTRVRTAGGPRATSPDGGSPETERAIASATPGRNASPPS